jgi:hypothetical protein
MTKEKIKGQIRKIITLDKMQNIKTALDTGDKKASSLIRDLADELGDYVDRLEAKRNKELEKRNKKRKK